jgi:RNA polymerase sigma-70 factor (sigma-E family)
MPKALEHLFYSRDEEALCRGHPVLHDDGADRSDQTMAESAEFDEFVRARSARLLQLAFLLIRDHALAEDLLQTALSRCWTAWSRIDGDPEPYVRRTLINTYNSWWSRRWRGERSTASPPDLAMITPHDLIDERDLVWRALAQLPRRQRMVIALRYFEDLTETQIAELMAISPSAVRSYAAKALAKLRVDPTLRTLPTPSPLEVPAGNERVAAVRHRISRDRRRRVAIATTAAVITAVLVGILAVAGPLRPPPPTTPTPSPTAFPSYQNGRRVAFYQEVSFADRDATTFTYTPTTIDLTIRVMCRQPDPGLGVTAFVRINGHRYGGPGCVPPSSMEFDATHMPSPETLAAEGIRVGEPVTITFGLEDPIKVVDGLHVPTDTIPQEGTIALAISEAVPFEQIPLPARPATLRPMTRPEFYVPSGGATWIRDTDPVTVYWSGQMRVTVRTQTPGELVVRLNGMTLFTFGRYDYSQRPWAHSFTAGVNLPEIPSGSEVTVTIEPRHMTGDWVVAVGPDEPRTVR